MSLFPPTSQTLLEKLAAEATGVSEASWARFFALYTPAIRRFAAANDSVHDPDDVVQEVYLKLVRILREGGYHPERARFRTYLALLIRHELITLYRRDQARGGNANVSLDALLDSPDAGRGTRPACPPPSELAVPADQARQADLAWARAKHEAAVEHVLTKVALSPQSRQVYRAYALEGASADAVAERFAISKDIVYKVKNRLDKMIEVVEEEMATDP